MAADFASMLYGTADKMTSNHADLAGSMAKGAQLALQKEQLQQAKAKLAHEAELAKKASYDKLWDNWNKIQTWKDPKAKKNAMIALKQQRDVMGAQEQFPDHIIESGLQSEEVGQRLNTLHEMYQAGEITLQQRNEIAADPIALGEISPTPLEAMPDGILSAPEATKQRIAQLNADREFREKQASRYQSAEQFRAEQERKTAENLQKRKEGLSSDLGKEQITGIRTGFNRMEQLVPGFLTGTVKEGDVRSATGVASQIPINLINDQNSEVRQTALGILNSHLKGMSGGAITDTELPRLATEAGMKIGPLEGGGWVATVTGAPSPESFVKGMRGIARKAKEREDQLKRAYGEDAWDAVVSYSTPYAGGARVTTSGRTPVGPQTEGQKPTAPKGPPKPKFDINELDNGERAVKLKKLLEQAPDQIEAAAMNYGVSVRALKKLLDME